MPSRKSRRKSDATARHWTPMVEGIVNPMLIEICHRSGARPPIAVFANDTYQCSVYAVGDENTPQEDRMLHLSIKRNDRHVIRDWRHLQAIKNEVCGRECTAVEIFPPESQLVDSANEYHLWVFGPGHQLPFGFDEYLVSSDDQIVAFNAGRERGEHKGRQRPFQPGLPVAEGRNESEVAKEDWSDPKWRTKPMRQRVPDREAS
jgi:hypothetical protein